MVAETLGRGEGKGFDPGQWELRVRKWSSKWYTLSIKGGKWNCFKRQPLPGSQCSNSSDYALILKKRVPPKHPYLPTRLNGVTAQNATIWSHITCTCSAPIAKSNSISRVPASYSGTLLCYFCLYILLTCGAVGCSHRPWISTVAWLHTVTCGKYYYRSTWSVASPEHSIRIGMFLVLVNRAIKEMSIC